MINLRKFWISAIYVNNNWCTNTKTLSSHCSQDLEYMTVTCRPKYLPWKFNIVMITAVYIPMDTNASSALTSLAISRACILKLFILSQRTLPLQILRQCATREARLTLTSSKASGLSLYHSWASQITWPCSWSQYIPPSGRVFQSHWGLLKLGLKVPLISCRTASGQQIRISFGFLNIRTWSRIQQLSWATLSTAWTLSQWRSAPGSIPTEIHGYMR